MAETILGLLGQAVGGGIISFVLAYVVGIPLARFPSRWYWPVLATALSAFGCGLLTLETQPLWLGFLIYLPGAVLGAAYRFGRKGARARDDGGDGSVKRRHALVRDSKEPDP